MKAEEVINVIRNNSVEKDEGSCFLAVIMRAGSIDIAGSITPMEMKVLAIKLVEEAVKAEIKAAL